MCGIAGIISKKNNVQSSLLEKIAQCLAHRGPDDQGIEIISLRKNNGYALGLVHRRLSIIDLSSDAHQPMYDESTKNWIVYNGEIYNFQEVKRTLLEKGCTFRSNSDTEVILKAYAIYGEHCLEKFRGMFAFALWDEKKQILFLAVDRIGIKPLYFYKNNDVLLFASEVRVFLKTGLVEKKINPLALDSFLAYGAVQSPLTIIDQVNSLMPGHYLIYDVRDKKINISQYWNLNSCVSEIPRHNSRLTDKLQDSIKSHLVSDVPVGLFLSGGVDSSATAILANKVSHQKFYNLSLWSFLSKNIQNLNTLNSSVKSFALSIPKFNSQNQIYILFFLRLLTLLINRL